MKKVKVSKQFLDNAEAKGLKITVITNEKKDAIHTLMIKEGISYWNARKIVMAKGGSK